MDLQTVRNFWHVVLYVGLVLGALSAVLVGLGTWRGIVAGKRIDAEAPLQQPITLAVAKARIKANTLDEIDAPTRSPNRGASLRLVSSEGEMLVLTTLETLKSPAGPGTALYELDLSLEPGSPAVNRPIGVLREASRAILHMSALPENAQVADGEIILTVNSTITVRLAIQEQTATKRILIIEDLTPLQEGLDNL
jgi:hypothetical protein